MKMGKINYFRRLTVANSQDAITLVGFFFMLSIFTIFYYFNGSEFDNFGAEYGRIATSIVNGEGFANVFDEHSGPTAWHPPLTVFFYALIFFLFGIQSTTSICLLLIFRNIFLTITLFFLLKVIDKTVYSRYRLLVAIIFLFQVFAVRLLTFNVEDIEVAIMLSSMMVYAILLVGNGNKSNSILIYFLAFILPLTVPSFALSFAILLFLIFLKNFLRVWKEEEKPWGIFFKNFFSVRRSKRELPNWFSTIVIAGVIFILSTSAWSYRNYLVFDDFIPIKSNLWFEFYLANNPNADGLYSFSKLNLDHPYRNKEVIRDYLELGEVAFIKNRKEKVLEYLKNNPDHYFQNTATRVRSAFVWTDMVKDVRDVDLKLFSENEIKEMNKTRLLYESKWTSLNMSTEDFLLALKKIELQREKDVYSDWKNQRELYRATKYSISNILAGLMLASIPILSMIIGMFINTIRNSQVFKIVIGIYIIHLLPYLLISHWYRYQLFLLALQSILIFLIISYVVGCLYPHVLEK